MEYKIEIEIYAKYNRSGKVTCVCLKQCKGCGSITCTEETAEIDRHKDWETTFKQDRYGKSKL
jgi:hypothetical protein